MSYLEKLHVAGIMEKLLSLFSVEITVRFYDHVIYSCQIPPKKDENYD